MSTSYLDALVMGKQPVLFRVSAVCLCIFIFSSSSSECEVTIPRVIQVRARWRFHIVYHAWSLCHGKYSSGNSDCLNAHCHKNHPSTVWCYSRVQFMCSFCVCVCVCVCLLHTREFWWWGGGGVLEIVQWSLFLNFLLCWYLMLSLVYSGDRMLS